MTISMTGLILRFLLGGFAVAASAVVGNRLGGRVGGIFAAFPAVFASAVIATAVGLPQAEAIEHTLEMSRGAFVGMALDIGCAIASGLLIRRLGWQKGLTLSVGGWIVAATVVYVGGAAMGWLR
ncbi:MAG TPA: DUF3147 family protein [Bacillota bacterium]|nr:DUF3147 family protein [Bacillota bacterium]